MGLAIGVDLGGTKIAAGVVDDSGLVLEQVSQPTPTDSAESIVNAISGIINDLRSRHNVEAACVAAPGFVDSNRSRIMVTANLPIEDLNLRGVLEDLVQIPVVIENDANAAAWAEVRFGAARNSRNMVMVTVGTGLGGGIVVERNLVRGAFGVAAEIGHMNYVPDGILCGCGQKGCWEQYASGSALVRYTRELASSRLADADKLLALGDGTVNGILGPHVTVAASEGCPVARAAFDWLGQNLGRGMATLSAVLDPHKYVIGGGVSAAGEMLLEPVRAAFVNHLSGASLRPLPEIVMATMGNDAGLVGAADLARVS